MALRHLHMTSRLHLQDRELSLVRAVRDAEVAGSIGMREYILGLENPARPIFNLSGQNPIKTKIALLEQGLSPSFLFLDIYQVYRFSRFWPGVVYLPEPQTFADLHGIPG